MSLVPDVQGLFKVFSRAFAGLGGAAARRKGFAGEAVQEQVCPERAISSFRQV
ncbi:hypothetical protein [Parasedimentitalea denitrificans]|uniref:hypothetical protein n=1 Tax=Parasedimentitalea denitrificans TaxID=2211118 RepID=UPI00143112A5|nr:hypothetical protein [Sedimentitalea sp. CY04]